MDRVKRIWYLSPMRAANVQASLRIHAVSPEPPLLAHTSSESRGTFRQKTRPLAPLNGLACAIKTCHDGMLEDTNSLDGAHIKFVNVILKALHWLLDCTSFVSRSQKCVQENWLQTRWGSIYKITDKCRLCYALSQDKIKQCESPLCTLK